MVEVTIKTDFAENGSAGQKEHKMAPCGLAVVACISPGNAREGYRGNSIVAGGNGMEMGKTAGLFAEMTAKALKDMAGGQEELYELIFAVYLEAFLKEAPDIEEEEDGDEQWET